MTDRYANIRKALEMGPTPGPWEVWDDVIYDDNDNFHVVRHFVTAHEVDVVGAYGVESDRPSAEADAAHIAACDPDTIRALLAERDALAEGLSDTEKDVAVAQAVEFAEYVERQAKGTMREAARRFLSLLYSQEVAKRLMERDAAVAIVAELCSTREGMTMLAGLVCRKMDQVGEIIDAAIEAANGGANG